MLKRILLLCLVSLGFLLTFHAAAEVVELTPVKDNTLFEDAEGRFSNGGGKRLFMGRVGPDGDELLRRTVLAFDLSDIPKKAVVNAVTLEFEIVQVPKPGDEGTPAGDTATLHLLESDWGEGFTNAPGNEGQGAAVDPIPPELPIDVGAVTWVHTFFDPDPVAATFWTSPGGDFQTIESASATFGISNPETLVFTSVASPDLINDVKNWISNPESNFGWMLMGDEIRPQNARAIASRENSGEPVPKLTVDYSIPSPTDFLSLNPMTAALTRPVGITHAGDGSGRLFIVEQQGRIRIYDTETGTLQVSPFLDIQDEVFSLSDSGGGNEQGLLGLAFHPDYEIEGENKGRFFVNYTTRTMGGQYRTVVAEYGVSGVDPDLALETGEVIMEFEQEARNHNGGDMHFGPDGYLYIASGDGGGGDDQYNNAQDIDTLRGAILRIDVDTVAPGGTELCSLVTGYGIPPNNAFPGADDGCDEILHYGLRNPWRFSFDALSGDLIIADVGQNDWEEINRVAGSASGLNFGWPCREGMHDFDRDPAVACSPPLTEPVLEYGHVDGNCSVTGGYVYRGNELPLTGKYLFGDWCSRRIWVGSNKDGTWSAEEWEGTSGILNSLSAFGQDENCELYVADRADGTLYRIEDGEIVFRNGLEQPLCQ